MKQTSKNHESLNIKIGVILSLLSFVVSMVVNVIFIRYINKPEIAGQSQYGLYTFSTSMTSLLLALSFGMNSSYVRFATIAKKENGEEGLKKINGSFALLFIIASILAVIIGAAIVLAFYYGLIGSNYDDTKRAIIISCIIFSVINVAVSLIGNIFTLYTNFHMRFIWARVLTITVSIMTPLITSIIIYFNHNIVTYVCVELGVNFLALLVNLLFCVKALKYRVKISFHKSDFHVLKNILFFSFFIFLVTAVTELTSSTPKMLLGLFPNSNGDSEITVAYYQLSATFIGAIAVAASAVSATYVPLVNRYVAYGSNDDVNRLFLKATKTMIVAYAIVMGGFIACGRQFVILWQGSHYENTDLIYYIACLLSLISFVPSTFGITSEVQRAKNRHHFRSFVLLIGFAVNFVVSLAILLSLPYFIDKNDSNYFVYQVVACAIGFGAGNVVNAVVMSIYNHRVIKLNMFDYYKTLLFYLFIVSISLAIGFVAFEFIPIKMSLLIELFARGLLFIVLFVLITIVFDRKFVTKLFRKGDLKIAQEMEIVLENNKVISDKKVYILRDFYKVVDSFKNSPNASLFDNETMGLLLKYNKKYDSKFVLIISKEIIFKKISKKILDDLKKNSNWLSVAFGAGVHSPYSFIDAPFINNDLSKFVKFFSKHDVKIENFVFPEFNITETQLNYFKSYYGLRIRGIGLFDEGIVESDSIAIRKNLLHIPCLNAKSGSGVLSYFCCSETSLIENKLKNGSLSISDFLKMVFAKKPYKEFYEKKVAVINTYNRLSTGNLAKTIMSAAERAGLTTKLFYGRLKDDEDQKSYYFGTNKYVNFLNNAYVKLSGNIGRAHYFETKALIKKLKEFEPDIVHLHNIGGNCLNYNLLFNYLRDKKVIVTMHDCFWLTGRCHHFTYSQQSCDNWKNGCGNCKHLDYYMKSYFFDKSKTLFKLKRSFINSCRNLKLVCISKWQKGFFDVSGIPNEKIELIYNGIDCSETNASKESSKLIKLIFVSSYLTKDKGIDEINKISSNLDPSKFGLEVVGKLPKKITLDGNIHYSGELSHNEVVKHIANSDVFVYPTHADTLPSVLIESLLVGTPIITYDVGGCSDIVQHDGDVIKYGDLNTFINAINDFDLSKYNREEISKRAKSRFNVKDMTDKYLSLYSEALRNE